MFHVSQLRKFIPDTFQPIFPYTIEVVIDLTFQPQPSHIVYYALKCLMNKKIPLVKVLWEESHPSEATLELESKMRMNCPHLFR